MSVPYIMHVEEPEEPLSAFVNTDFHELCFNYFQNFMNIFYVHNKQNVLISGYFGIIFRE